MKPIVYIASAYTKGDPAINTHFQCAIFDRLMKDDLVTPYAPLWSHFQHTLFPLPYEKWLEYDTALIASGAFDACLRLTSVCESVPGYEVSESGGADREVAKFEAMKLPVFYSIDDLYLWFSGRPLAARTHS